MLTGAPGAGKTSLLAELAGRGQRTVPEAATDLIAEGQRRGVAEPEREPPGARCGSSTGPRCAPWRWPGNWATPPAAERAELVLAAVNRRAN